jgi:hypothetical protein
MAKVKAELFLAAIKDALSIDSIAVVMPLKEAAGKLSWRYFFATMRLEGNQSDVSRKHYGRMSVRQARQIMAEVEADILRHTDGAPYRIDLAGVGPLFEENGLVAAAGGGAEYDGPDEPTWPAATEAVAA